ncbi:MAG TPA: beta-phosphoglucomutase [Flavobacteriaceae bacterium]|nr:beta-phosphoglucomutase [Flavobacteriaceae bacterium]MCB9213552.1 beta-phosphoglucomutase [Alteromonas sp.]HPF10778.1 beta-phosphoglucomutase [Flavobacteriaceae bacterium]HQU21514.1 beta-phosphoglucomutase [Flavobacteriaceae bacterium]HQU65483.1 beta-phosphoglucomutase [Flavobacteriaceae bacterium]
MHRRGFIFDLDGVIVDTAKYHYFAWKKLANGLGIGFNEEDNEHLKGVSRVRSLEIILEWGKASLSKEKFQELLVAKNEDYLSYVNQMNEDEILPDVPRVLSFLKRNKQPMALGSASKNATSILKRVRLLNEFQAIVDGNKVTKAKPDPEVFLIAAEALRIEPKDCIVFEDSLAGIQAANTAGMLSIGIGDAAILSEADYVFKDFTEISNDFLTTIIQSS